MRRAAILCLTALLSACQAYHPTSIAALESPHPVRATYQVWVGGHAQELHAVRVTRDSLYGVPFFKPPECDSCVVAIPRASIDSIRTYDAAESAVRTGGMGLGIFMALPVLTIVFWLVPHWLAI